MKVTLYVKLPFFIVRENLHVFECFFLHFLHVSFQAGHEAGMSGDFECSRTCELIGKGIHGFDPKAELDKAKAKASSMRAGGGPTESSHLTEGMGRQ